MDPQVSATRSGQATSPVISQQLQARDESILIKKEPSTIAMRPEPKSSIRKRSSPSNITPKFLPKLRKLESSAESAYRARPVRSCTHCRQQKIKCNALETFPAPCTRCAKMDRKCVVDPSFRPQKGGQVQLLRDDISSLKQQLAELQRKSGATGSPDSLSPTHESQSPFHGKPYFHCVDLIT